VLLRDPYHLEPRHCVAGGVAPVVSDVVVRLSLRAGLANVTSVGENDMTSFEPVGRTCRKSPSAGSPSAITLPERPSDTPTAAGVNHTMGGRPSASSAAICRISVSDNGCGLVRGDDMVYSGRARRHRRAKSMPHGTDKSTSRVAPGPRSTRRQQLSEPAPSGTANSSGCTRGTADPRGPPVDTGRSPPQCFGEPPGPAPSPARGERHRPAAGDLFAAAPGRRSGAEIGARSGSR